MKVEYPVVEGDVVVIALMTDLIAFALKCSCPFISTLVNSTASIKV
jgi:hypothetical protein